MSREKDRNVIQWLVNYTVDYYTRIQSNNRMIHI